MKKAWLLILLWILVLLVLMLKPNLFPQPKVLVQMVDVPVEVTTIDGLQLMKEGAHYQLHLPSTANFEVLSCPGVKNCIQIERV